MGKKQSGTLMFCRVPAFTVKQNEPSVILDAIKIQTRKPVVIEGSISCNGAPHNKLHMMPIPTDPKPKLNTIQKGPRMLRLYRAFKSVNAI